jgi:hypothetical protein
MRLLSLALVTALVVSAAACSDDDGSGDDGSGGRSTGGRAGGGDAGETSTGGRPTSSEVSFVDLPGKIRFINHVSDGTAGVHLDLYWGTSIARSEPVGTIEYGEITDFMTPRRLEDTILDPTEARFFLVLEGDVSGTPSTFLVQDDQTFTDGTVLTIALVATENTFSDALNVSEQVFYEDELSTPPAGTAHVFAWSVPFSQIDDGDFVLVGTDTLCDPDPGEPGGANLGRPAVIPEGHAELSLFDANTEPPCSTGAGPVSAELEAGHSYVLLGEAETYEIDARRLVLLELGTEN